MPDRPLCTAHNKRGGPCSKPAVPGLTVCRYHGGGSPQSKAKSARYLATQQAVQQAEQATRQAEKAAARLGLLVDVSPEQALLDEVRRAAAMVTYYGQRVQQLEANNRESLVWGVTREKTGGDDRGTTWEAGPNVWLRLWNDERDRLTRVATAALKAGIEERRVRLAENHGQLVAGVIRRVLDRLQLTDTQAQLVATVVPQELRALEAN